MKNLVVRSLAVSALGFAAVVAQAGPVYFNDFESGLAPEFSPAPITLAPNASTTFLGRFGGDGPTGTVLTLTGLAAHAQITLSFDLYIIQSWDGTGNLGFGPDSMLITSGAETLVDASFGNRDASTQSYSDATPLGGGPFSAKTDADGENTLGYPDLFGTNTVYSMTFTFAHTGSTFTASFSGVGLQAIGDESWGLDNVSVTSDAVPEPCSLAALGLGIAAVLKRRRGRIHGISR